MPIINIDINDCIDDLEREAFFEIFGPYGSETRDLYLKTITIRKRGGSSRMLPKTPYRIQFFKSKKIFIKDEKSILKESEDWALDALYADSSKIRNKLGSEVWNLINNIKNNNLKLNVMFIELYINNEYQGLYTIKDIVTRKKLNLKQTTKNDSSILVKGINYIPIDWEYGNFNFNSDNYNSLEMKYPNNLDYFSIYWPIFLNKLSHYYKTDENNWDNIKKTFDVNNFLDFKIFSELIVAVDNDYIKNTYLVMLDKNSDVMIIPWDMDLTFGLYFDEYQPLLSVKNYSLVNQPLNNSNFIGDEAYLKALKERYFYLRKNGLNKEYIFNLIDMYVEDIYYASLRDSERWYEYDIIKETNEIKDWVSKRFDYLDKKFKGL